MIPGLAARVRAAGVTRDVVRRLTRGPDTLFSPLQPTRECLYSDAPECVVVREVFCGPDYHIRFVENLLIVSDYLDGRPDAVMGAGETTAVLYRAARPGVGRTLDLGCGAGTLALLLARDAEHVVATDINPRAVEFCRYNAEQNGIANVEVREGSLFKPVRGEEFDLIVSQPPYYPGDTQTFLHGGAQGHELAERILFETPAHLRGRAVIHASWPLDWQLPRIPGVRLVERTPGIGEVEGTRHSLIYMESGEGVERIDIDPGRWGV